MDPLLNETEILFKTLFDEEEKMILKNIESNITQSPQLYEISQLWFLDRKIGGIGAYSMPGNPIINPIPGGIGRTIYRPLQYVKADIEKNNIYDNARYAIQNVGLHLEGLVKYIIKKERSFPLMPSSKMTLGQCIGKLNRKKYEPNLFRSLSCILEIYNLSKHGVSNDESRRRTFSPMDALIFYLASRKVGNALLTYYKSDLHHEIGNFIDRLDIS